MGRPERTDFASGFPVYSTAAAGLIGAIGFVGVSVAAGIAILDNPAEVGAPAVRIDPPPASEHHVAEHATFVAINEARSTAGLSGYEWNDVVAVAAQRHSADMAVRRTMSHTGSDGSNAGDRIARAGFAASTWAENIAAGFVDPVVVVRAWMASSSHRRNLLGDFRFVGVGIATSDVGVRYWTLDLTK